MAATNRTVSPTVAAVWLLVLGCLGFAVVDNVRLRTRLEALTNDLQRSREVPLGAVPGAITAIDPQANGAAIREELGAETTIVLVASFSCVFSKNSMPVWRDLAASLPTTRFVLLRVDGRSSKGDPGAKYSESTFAFPERPELRWIVPSESTVEAYRLGYVPQTIVARKGQIRFVRTGPLAPEHIAHIRSAAL